MKKNQPPMKSKPTSSSKQNLKGSIPSALTGSFRMNHNTANTSKEMMGIVGDVGKSQESITLRYLTNVLMTSRAQQNGASIIFSREKSRSGVRGD